MSAKDYPLDKRNPYEEGLEVAPSDAPVAVNPDHSGAQVAPLENAAYALDRPDYSDLEVLPNQDLEIAEKLDQRSQKDRDSRICGLRRRTFWLALVVAVVVIGAAVGGGVGGALATQDSDSANEDDESSSSSRTSAVSSGTAETISSVSTTASSSEPISSSSSSSTSTAVTSGTTGLAARDCDNGTTISTSSNVRYLQYCNTDWPDGFGSIEGTGDVSDVQYVTTYTFEDCMNACDAYNVKAQGECRALTYNANLTAALGFSGGNCILKSARADQDWSCENCASALVVSS